LRDVRFGSKADTCTAQANVCYRPIADITANLDERSSAGQDNCDFGELARLCIDFDQPAMLFDNDVVANREPQSGALSGGFRREEWIKHLVLYVIRNTRAVVAYRCGRSDSSRRGNCHLERAE